MAAPDFRKRVLRVIFVSLLLDLISFTFILPLFPKLLEFYRNLDAESGNTNTVLNQVLRGLNTYKNSFARPINDRYDIVLLGGALGSLFSLCQAIASPIIGTLSDTYGRRTALMWSMVGNILSVALWVAATDFRTFLASRVVGGLSEGNVQLALAIATDISDEKQRGSTMALVGVCFSIAFTFGPALGAYLANITTVAANPFATAAAFSLFLIVTETLYLYFSLPETHVSSSSSKPTDSTPTTNGHAKSAANIKSPRTPTTKEQPHRTNSHFLLNFTHFAFILFFSGIEFSLPFLTYNLFQYDSRRNGSLLGFIGLIASLLQGSLVRRLPPLLNVRIGVLSCCVAFFLLSQITSRAGLYAAATGLAVTSSTVVTGLTSLSSLEAGQEERGGKLGNHRSWGQVGRALGPLVFCSLYWWTGRDLAYRIGGAGMIGVAGIVWGFLRQPKIVEGKTEKAA
ncbi:tetracycline transporter [Viridothelium virens]|uniref:Tetracycline transporter n=1 Tax=Viridothelium virens TaxID=1048519 RepID=A0A6A6HL94_VIRVR|nr:tetracycline transporter [Viridothelium virens]